MDQQSQSLIKNTMIIIIIITIIITEGLWHCVDLVNQMLPSTSITGATNKS